MEFRYNGNANKGGIYKITNTQNGRAYYGSAKGFKQRWSQHASSLRKNKHSNRFLQADYNKCLDENGTENFLIFEVLEVVEDSKEERLKREENYLKQHFDDGEECYNLCTRAISKEGHWPKNPKETKRKQSEAAKRRMLTPEGREQIEKALLIGQQTGFRKGLKHTEETKEKMSATRIGKRHTAETRQKMSKIRKGKPGAWIGKKHTEETKRKISANAKKRTILASNTETKEEQIFFSIKEAHQCLNISKVSISRVLSGTYRQVKKYTFKYITKSTNNESTSNTCQESN